MGKILIIDDDELSRDVLKSMLEHDGHEVVEASDGEEGITVYSQHPIDLVVTDIRMPGMSGKAVVSELRRRDPNAKIIVVAGGDEEVLAEARQWDTGVALPKPYHMEDLLAAMRRVLIRVP